MFNPTREQIYFIVAIVLGLVIGKLIKNYKVAFGITIIILVILALKPRKRKE